VVTDLDNLHGRLKAKWERAMQNLIQTVMQQWPRTAERRVMNREALLLSTSAMMAMLLVGCDSDDDTPKADVIAMQISNLVADSTSKVDIDEQLQSPSDYPDATYGFEITSIADFITAVRGFDSVAFIYQQTKTENAGTEDEVTETTVSMLRSDSFTVEPSPVSGLYLLTYSRDLSLGEVGEASSLLQITSDSSYVLHNEKENILVVQGEPQPHYYEVGDETYYLCNKEQEGNYLHKNASCGQQVIDPSMYDEDEDDDDSVVTLDTHVYLDGDGWVDRTVPLTLLDLNLLLAGNNIKVGEKFEVRPIDIKGDGGYSIKRFNADSSIIENNLFVIVEYADTEFLEYYPIRFFVSSAGFAVEGGVALEMQKVENDDYEYVYESISYNQAALSNGMIVIVEDFDDEPDNFYVFVDKAAVVEELIESLKLEFGTLEQDLLISSLRDYLDGFISFQYNSTLDDISSLPFQVETTLFPSHQDEAKWIDVYMEVFLSSSSEHPLINSIAESKLVGYLYPNSAGYFESFDDTSFM
jgi:hypothetical protein